MGGVFSFIGNQYRLTVDGDDFFVDILMFHRRLRCMVTCDIMGLHLAYEFKTRPKF